MYFAFCEIFFLKYFSYARDHLYESGLKKNRINRNVREEFENSPMARSDLQ